MLKNQISHCRKLVLIKSYVDGKPFYVRYWDELLEFHDFNFPTKSYFQVFHGFSLNYSSN